MHRQYLQQQLNRHQAHDANEQRMLDETIRFVNEHSNCFDRHLQCGHITGSAWIVDLDRSHALLTHHRKLDRWLQLGGHSDGDSNTLDVALREGREESGLEALSPVSESIFDVDVHLIPARKNEPNHYHYDIRFLLEANRDHPLVISDESNQLAWVALKEIKNLVADESILRMLDKTYALKN